MRLIHIAPQLPPTVGGVADYTAILSQRLVDVSDGAIQPVLVGAGWKDAPEPAVEFPAIDQSSQCNPRQLAHTIGRLVDEAGGESAVLLEYSGYGFAKRGAPWWLVQGLKRVRAERPGLRIITMFHELYATGPPWTSAFWLSPAQQYVAAELARLSDAVVTNRTSSAQWLRERVDETTPVTMQPVFSNVGEPSDPPPFSDREDVAVIFGGRSMKQRLYQTVSDTLVSQLEALEITRVVELGRPVSEPALGPFPVEQKGILPAPVISEQLGRARVGLLHYPVDCLTKSGVWSSYAAHGVPVVVVSARQNAYPLRNVHHFYKLNEDTETIEFDEFKKLSNNSFDWYNLRARTLKSAKKFADLVMETKKDEFT